MSQLAMPFRSLLPVSSLLLLAASTAHAAEYSGPVSKAEWATGVPDYMDMFIALPDNMPENPPILVNIHSCGNNAGGQWGYDGFAPLREAMDSVGFIMILPQQSRNCWNVGATESLTHDGGGDTLAIVQMVQYALEKYNGDPTRVYAMGGSGGGMMTQALLAVYPEVFKAGHARAGVPAGCWAEGYLDQPDQWSGPCANGTVNKSALEWGDYVRGINPAYDGPRPRVQLNHGNNDETISFNNFGEAIEEWSNVLGLDEAPTSTDSNYQGGAATYDRQFWEDSCGYTVLEAWEALGQGHSMGYESVAILEWFGLDEVRDQDPWDAACGDMGEPGDTNGGAGATAASAGAGTAGAEASAGVGGTSATGGAAGAAGAPSGAAGATGGAAGATGGAVSAAGGAGGAMAAAGGASGNASGAGAPTTVGAGASGLGPVASEAGAAGAAGALGAVDDAAASNTDGGGSDGGCSLVVGSSTGGALPLGLFALGLVLRRRRHPSR